MPAGHRLRATRAAEASTPAAFGVAAADRGLVCERNGRKPAAASLARPGPPRPGRAVDAAGFPSGFPRDRPGPEPRRSPAAPQRPRPGTRRRGPGAGGPGRRGPGPRPTPARRRRRPRAPGRGARPAPPPRPCGPLAHGEVLPRAAEGRGGAQAGRRATMEFATRGPRPNSFNVVVVTATAAEAFSISFFTRLHRRRTPLRLQRRRRSGCRIHQSGNQFHRSCSRLYRSGRRLHQSGGRIHR